MSPRGSSVYLIFPLINAPTFPPVAGSKNTNNIMAKRKSNGQDPTIDPAKTVISINIDPRWSCEIDLPQSRDTGRQRQIELLRRGCRVCLGFLHPSWDPTRIESPP